MRLICPNCDAQYEVDASMLPPEGRDVQCSACGKVWFHSSAPAKDPETAWARGAAPAAGDPPPAEARFLSDEDLEEEGEGPTPSGPLAWQEAWDRALGKPGPEAEGAPPSPAAKEAGGSGFEADFAAELEDLSERAQGDPPPSRTELAARRAYAVLAQEDPPAESAGNLDREAGDWPANASADAEPASAIATAASRAANDPMGEDRLGEDRAEDRAAERRPAEDLIQEDRTGEEWEAEDWAAENRAAGHLAAEHLAAEDRPAGDGRFPDVPVSPPAPPTLPEAALSAPAPPANLPPHTRSTEDDFSEGAATEDQPMPSAAFQTSAQRTPNAAAQARDPETAARLAALAPAVASEDLDPLEQEIPTEALLRRLRRSRPELPPEEPEEPFEEGDHADLMPRRPKLDEEKLALLREEAERETRARAVETARASGRGLEMQPDLGLPEGEAPARLHIGPRSAPPEPEDIPTATETAGPQNRSPRRELLPDIERINQTLSASGTARGKAELPPLQAAEAQRKGFRRGFLLALTFAVLLALLYQNADSLSGQVPMLRPPLDGLVALVDGARLGIDQLLRRLLDSQSL